jgi:predicted RNA-binding Zn ribbon-like protein
MSSPRAIRFGGVQTPQGFRFELSGGALPLDFVNTLDERPRGGRERLNSPEDMVAWARQAGLIEAAQAVTLPSPHQEAELAEAIALRELIFATVELIRGRRPADDALTPAWNLWLERLAKSRQLTVGPQGMAWHQQESPTSLAGLMPPIAQAAMDLFQDPARCARLRICAAANCDWVFLDKSPRGNRIWCDMSVCGNRAKAARHYHRHAPGHAAL